jgi:serine/threonine protein phosphatase PrpC
MRNEQIKWNYGLCTHKGLSKSINEDRLFLRLGQSEHTTSPVIALIADGMGGYGHGELASEMCLEMVKKWWGETATLFDQSLDTFFSVISVECSHLFQKINAHLYAYLAECQIKLGTTLSLLIIYKESFVIVHVGDSRIYQLNSDSINQLTVDHSWVNDQISLGFLSEEEARIHPQRNVLTQCLGLTPDVDVFTCSNTYGLDALLLICSDGFHALFTEGEILSLVMEYLGNISDLQQLSEQLVQLALDRGAKDNVSVLLLRQASLRKGSSFWSRLWKA